MRLWLLSKRQDDKYQFYRLELQCRATDNCSRLGLRSHCTFSYFPLLRSLSSTYFDTLRVNFDVLARRSRDRGIPPTQTMQAASPSVEDYVDIVRMPAALGPSIFSHRYLRL